VHSPCVGTAVAPPSESTLSLDTAIRGAPKGRAADGPDMHTAFVAASLRRQ
jgi:hypothetical protein